MPTRWLHRASLLAIVHLACFATAHVYPAGARPCIDVQRLSSLKIDDAGNTTEPVLLVVEAHGDPEDLKSGEVVYAEDDREVNVIEVGNLVPGVQTLTIPAGLHTQSSDHLLIVSLLRPDGSNMPGVRISMHDVGYVPVAARAVRKGLRKPTHYSQFPDPSYEIAVLDAGEDADEVMSIARFTADAIGLTSVEGEPYLTEEKEHGSHPQTLSIRGVNLKNGMLVHFSTKKGGQEIEATSPLTQTKVVGTLRFLEGEEPRNISTSLYASIVVVPPAITHAVRSDIRVRSAGCRWSN